VGLFLIFAVVGVTAWTLRNLLLPVISVFELAAAVLVIFMGLQILIGGNFLSFHLQATAPQPKSFAGLFFFGVAYGLAAVGCSAPIFFSILLYAISTGGFLNVTVTFLVYAMTMGQLSSG
jgi:cytochrome c-type biogenesis protein